MKDDLYSRIMSDIAQQLLMDNKLSDLDKLETLKSIRDSVIEHIDNIEQELVDQKWEGMRLCNE